RGDHGRPRARQFPAPEGGRARMTSIEVPYSIAAALPTLSVMDITNEVSKAVASSGKTDGIAYVTAGDALSLVRVQERETGFFEDLECMLERVACLHVSLCTLVWCIFSYFSILCTIFRIYLLA